MTTAQQFPFISRAVELGAASLAPMLPLTLVAARSVAVSGLLDTGVPINVLPYATGVELGAGTWPSLRHAPSSWEQQNTERTKEGEDGEHMSHINPTP